MTVSALVTFIQHCLARIIRQEKNYPDMKGELTLFLLTDDKTLYIENPKEFAN